MAKIINSKQKLCKIMTNGRIPELGNICGPVTSPCRVDLRKVVNMVQRGLRVYEINPKNYSEEVLLTIKNVTLNNFKEPEKVVFPEEEKVEVAPVVKKADVIQAEQENIQPTPVKTESVVEDIVEQALSAAENIPVNAQATQSAQTPINTSKNDFKKKH